MCLDAANDVYAGLQIYLRLKQMGADRKIPIDLDEHSGVSKNLIHPIKPNGTSSGSGVPRTAENFPNSHPVRLAPGFHKYPPPRQLNALAAFKSGTNIIQFAKEAGIKTATVEGYICDALAVLVDDTLDKEEMARLIPQIKDIRVRRKFKILISRMRRSIGELDVDSDATMSVSDSEDGDGGIQQPSEAMNREVGVDPLKNTVDDLAIDMGKFEISSEAQEYWQADDMLDGDHGWTKEELEEAMRMRDSDGDYDLKP